LNLKYRQTETELLVEHGLKQLENIQTPKILDIGIGSGAVLLSLLHERRDAQGVGVDISQNALKIANENAEILSLEKRVEFKQSDYLSAVDEKFDLIISNPPYIDAGAMEKLTKTVSFEPILALSGGSDGLSAYRKIIGKASKNLKPRGSIIFEIGYDQGQAVSELLAASNFVDIYIEKDLAIHDRLVCGNLSV